VAVDVVRTALSLLLFHAFWVLPLSSLAITAITLAFKNLRISATVWQTCEIRAQSD
jgi:hypothetical protein